MQCSDRAEVKCELLCTQQNQHVLHSIVVVVLNSMISRSVTSQAPPAEAVARGGRGGCSGMVGCQ